MVKTPKKKPSQACAKKQSTGTRARRQAKGTQQVEGQVASTQAAPTVDTTPGDAAPSGTSTVPQNPGVADEMQVGMQGACNLRSLPPQEYPQAPVMDFSQLTGAHIQAPQPGLLNDMSRIDNLSALVGMYVPQLRKKYGKVNL